MRPAFALRAWARPRRSLGGGGAGPDSARRFGAVDGLLVLVVLIWGVNFSVVKAAIANLPPLFFNSLRLVGASLLLLTLARLAGAPRPPCSRCSWTPSDLRRVVLLALVGHTGYQTCFILGLYGTSASESALLLGTTPVAVAIVGAVTGVDRPSRRAWLGTLVSLAGVTLIIGRSAYASASLRGELLTVAATFCWAVYTVGSADLLARHGPLRVTAYSMALGTVFFLPLALPSSFERTLSGVPLWAWLGLVYSCVFALAVSYYLWYYAVARLGPTRTAIYSNLTPVAALGVAMLVFGESLTTIQLVGAVVILLGVYLVRKSPPAGSRGDRQEPAAALVSGRRLDLRGPTR